MDDLTADVVKRITNWKDERLVIGRVKATGAAVYAVLCRGGAIKCYQTDRNLKGERIDAKGALIMYNKVDIFPEINRLDIRQKLMSKKKAIEERCKKAIRAAKGTNHKLKQRRITSIAPMARRESSV